MLTPGEGAIDGQDASALIDTAPLSSLAQALAMFSAVQGRADAAGIALRAPPPQPVGCCGRGCTGCVWEGFYAAAHWWREDALSLLG